MSEVVATRTRQNALRVGSRITLEQGDRVVAGIVEATKGRKDGQLVFLMTDGGLLKMEREKDGDILTDASGKAWKLVSRGTKKGGKRIDISRYDDVVGAAVATVMETLPTNRRYRREFNLDAKHDVIVTMRRVERVAEAADESN